MAGNILGALLLEIVTKANTSGLDKTDRSLKRTGKTLKNIHKEAGFLSKMTNRLMGGLSLAGIAYGFNKYAQFEKDLGAIHSRFFAITKDEQKAKEEFGFIRGIAKDTANDIKSMADSYSIFYSATSKSLGQEGARSVFQNWSRVGRVLHLTDYQMERVTYALREMASKGAIYSQDLRMQIGTHVPNAMGLAQKAAEEMGITGTDWFDKLQKSAKGNAKVTSEFIKLFSKYAEMELASPEALKKAMQQPDALAQMIKNLRTEFGIKVSEAGGKDMVVGVLQGIYNILERIPADKIANVIGKLGSGIGYLFKQTQEIINILRDIAIYLFARTLFKGIGSLFNKIAKSAFFINLKYIFRNGFKEGFKNVFAGAKHFFKYMLLKHGAKAILVKAVARFIPFLGQAILFFDIFRNIWNIIKGKFGFGEKDKIFGKYGTTAKDFYNTLNDITKNKGINTTEKLQQALAQTDAGKLLWANAQFNDNGDVIININGTNLTQDQLKDMAVETVKDIKDNKKDKYADKFQVPINTRQRKLGR